MKSHKGESQSEFLDRCVPEMIGTDENKRPREQAVAICLDIWRNSKQARQAPDPDPGESHSDFIDRCTSELEDEGRTHAMVHRRIAPFCCSSIPPPLASRSMTSTSRFTSTPTRRQRTRWAPSACTSRSPAWRRCRGGDQRGVRPD